MADPDERPLHERHAEEMSLLQAYAAKNPAAEPLRGTVGETLLRLRQTHALERIAEALEVLTGTAMDAADAMIATADQMDDDAPGVMQ